MTVLPVGSVVLWLTSAEVPAGWTWADGSTFDPDKYPELAEALGGNTLPNLPAHGLWPPHIIKTTTAHDPEPEEVDEPEPYDMNRDRAIRTAKVQALREAADALPYLDRPKNMLVRQQDAAAWLRERANQIERGEA